MSLLQTLKRESLYSLGSAYSPPPLSVTIEVNYDCMLRCSMCQLWKKSFKDSRMGGKKLITGEEIKGVIDELSAIGVGHIHFCGGEPLLRKDLLDTFAYSVSKGIPCSSFTNGYLVDKKMAERLVASGVGSISFSMDGPDARVHDSIRGVDGAFERAVSGIRSLMAGKEALSARSPEVIIHCTVSSRNVGVLPGMVGLAKSLGVRHLRFNYLSVIGEKTVEATNAALGERAVGEHSFGNVPESWLLTDEDIGRLPGIIREIEALSREELQCEIDPALKGGERTMLREGTFPVTRCRVPWRSAIITPVMDVIPCPMFTDLVLGNLREESFGNIWNGKRSRAIRKRLFKGLLPVCRKCCMIHSDFDPLWKRAYKRVFGTRPAKVSEK